MCCVRMLCFSDEKPQFLSFEIKSQSMQNCSKKKRKNVYEWMTEQTYVNRKLAYRSRLPSFCPFFFLLLCVAYVRRTFFCCSLRIRGWTYTVLPFFRVNQMVTVLFQANVENNIYTFTILMPYFKVFLLFLFLSISPIFCCCCFYFMPLT